MLHPLRHGVIKRACSKRQTNSEKQGLLFFELQVETTRVALREGGVELRLRIVDTPGFGDAVDNSNW